MAKENGEKAVTPYIPWETFVSFVAHLKATTTPSRIDKSVMPVDMPPLVRGQVQSALRFLGLIDEASTTQPTLRKLVEAYDTKGWTDGLIDDLIPAYDGVIGDLDLDHATRHQLDERFGNAGIAGQMRLKSIRFYLSLLTAAGRQFSPHLTARQKSRPSGPPRRRKNSDAQAHTQTTERKHKESEQTPDPRGTVSYPMFFKGKPEGRIVVPANIGPEDKKVLDLTMQLVAAYADQASK